MAQKKYPLYAIISSAACIDFLPTLMLRIHPERSVSLDILNICHKIFLNKYYYETTINR